MAKVTVLKCDLCGQWASEENTVRTVTVVGPRFDLDAACRAHLLTTTGVQRDKAEAYVAMVDAQTATPGVKPSLNSVLDATAPESAPADSAPIGDGTGDEEDETTQEEAGGQVADNLIPLPFDQASSPSNTPVEHSQPSRRKRSS